jgi:hypothetical protein
VTFSDGTTVVGQADLVDGVATLSFNGYSGGTLVLRTVYSGDTFYQPSSNGPLSFTDRQRASQITLSASPNPNVLLGPPLFTATVSSVDGVLTPTGTVTFNLGSTSVTVNLVHGVASYLPTSVPGGSYTVSAVYNGDANYGASTSNTLTEGTTPTTSTTLTVSPAQPVAGQPLTLTAEVIDQSQPGLVASVVTGSVTFSDGTTVLGTVSLSGTGAVLTLPAGLTAGTHDLKAVYSGDVTFQGSNGSTSVAVSSTSNILQSFLVLPAPAGNGQPTNPPPTVTNVPPPVLVTPPQPIATVPPGGSLLGLVEVVVVSRGRHGLQQMLLLTNISGEVIEGPLYLVLDGLSKDVHLKNGSGKISKGHPHAGASFLLLPVNELQPGQSLTLTLSFSAANGAVPHFTAVLLAGSGAV